MTHTTNIIHTQRKFTIKKKTAESKAQAAHIAINVQISLFQMTPLDYIQFSINCALMFAVFLSGIYRSASVCTS